MKTIGFIGKTTITPAQRKHLIRMGAAIGAHGNPITAVDGKGTVDAIWNGYHQTPKTMMQFVASGVIEAAGHTFIFADERLLNRLRTAYPDIDTRDDVSLMTADNLPDWVAAVEQVQSESIRP